MGWTLTCRDLFDRDSDPSEEAAGEELPGGLATLWEHHLREGFLDDGQRSFSDFTLRWDGPPRAFASIDYDAPAHRAGAPKLKRWLGPDLLGALARAHLQLLKEGWTRPADVLLAEAEAADDESAFLARLQELARSAVPTALDARHDHLLQNVLRALDDDAPRLVYADWLAELGDPRGELIQVQCRLARLPDDAAERVPLAARERVLLQAHQRTWGLPLAGLASDWRFVRGFVEEVALKADPPPGEGALFPVHPVRRVRLEGTGCRAPGPLLARLPFVTGLELGWYFTPEDRVAPTPELGRLTALWLPLGDLGNVEEALGAGHLDGLEALALGRGDEDEKAVHGLARRAPPRLRGLRLGQGIAPAAAQELARSERLLALRELEVSSNQSVGPDVVAALAQGLRGLEVLRLRLTRAGDAALAALSRSAWPLVELDVSGSVETGNGLRALVEAAPKTLTSLDLSWNHLNGAAIRPLGDTGLPCLRRLVLAGVPLGDEGVVLLTRSQGAATLRILDLSETGVGAAGLSVLVDSPHTSELRVLHLRGVELRDEAVEVLLRARSTLHTLEINPQRRWCGEEALARLHQRFGAGLMLNVGRQVGSASRPVVPRDW